MEYISTNEFDLPRNLKLKFCKKIEKLKNVIKSYSKRHININHSELPRNLKLKLFKENSFNFCRYNRKNGLYISERLMCYTCMKFASKAKRAKSKCK